MPAHRSFPVHWLWAVLVIVAVGLGAVRLWGMSPIQPTPEPGPNVTQGPGYQAVNPDHFQISILAEGLSAPTRMKITPDGKYLLVSQLTGEVIAFRHQDDTWTRLPGSALTIETGFPGFPPEEGGLASIVFSADYATSYRVFFLHNSRTPEGKVRNRVSSSVLTEINAQPSFSPPEVIYEANFDGSPSHQITDGLGLMVQNQPHLLLLVGEGFKASRATDPTIDGGKVILIQDNGSLPLGKRPYPQNPRIQATGLRNAFVIAPNPFDSDQRLFIADTGPDKYDRLIYTRLIAPENNNRFRLTWAGTVTRRNWHFRFQIPTFPLYGIWSYTA